MRTLLTASAGAALLIGEAELCAGAVTIIDLGTLGGPDVTTGPGSEAFGISSAGVVVGCSVLTDLGPDTKGFRWNGSTMVTLEPLAGDEHSVAFGICAGGTIVGQSFNVGGLSGRGVMWDASGVPTLLGDFEPRDVNCAGNGRGAADPHAGRGRVAGRGVRGWRAERHSDARRRVQRGARDQFSGRRRRLLGDGERRNPRVSAAGIGRGASWIWAHWGVRRAMRWGSTEPGRSSGSPRRPAGCGVGSWRRSGRRITVVSRVELGALSPVGRASGTRSMGSVSWSARRTRMRSCGTAA